MTSAKVVDRGRRGVVWASVWRGWVVVVVGAGERGGRGGVGEEADGGRRGGRVGDEGGGGRGGGVGAVAKGVETVLVVVFVTALSDGGVSLALFPLIALDALAVVAVVDVPALVGQNAEAATPAAFTHGGGLEGGGRGRWREENGAGFQGVRRDGGPGREEEEDEGRAVLESSRVESA